MLIVLGIEFLIGLVVLYFGVVALQFLLKNDSIWKQPPLLAIFSAVILLQLAIVATFIGTLMKKRWARALTIVIQLVPLCSGATLLVTNPLYLILISIAVIGIVAAALQIRAVRVR